MYPEATVVHLLAVARSSILASKGVAEAPNPNPRAMTEATAKRIVDGCQGKSGGEEEVWGDRHSRDGRDEEDQKPKSWGSH